VLVAMVKIILDTRLTLLCGVVHWYPSRVLRFPDNYTWQARWYVRGFTTKQVWWWLLNWEIAEIGNTHQ